MCARTSVKYSCRLLRSLGQVGEHVQIMHDSTPSQLNHILAHSPVAGASALPGPDVRQSMLHGSTLPQLRTALRCLLAFPHLLQPGFIGMHADAVARGARGTP